MNLLASVILASLGPAERGPTVSLDWSAPEACPRESTVRRDVDAMLGEDDAREQFEFGVLIAREGELYRLELVTRHGAAAPETRTIRAAGCDELVDAAVLMIAIALDPVATSQTVRAAGWTRTNRPAAVPAPSPEPEVSAIEPSAPREVQRQPAKAAAVPRDFRFGIRPQFNADWGALPAFAPGVGLNLSTWRGLWRFEVVGAYWPQQRASREDVSKRGAWVELGTVAPRACLNPTSGPVSFPTCVGVELGSSRNRGIGTELASPKNAFWIGAVGGPTLIWAFVPRVAIAVGIEIGVPFVRRRVETTDGDTLHLAEPVSLRPLGGIEVRL